MNWIQLFKVLALIAGTFITVYLIVPEDFPHFIAGPLLGVSAVAIMAIFRRIFAWRKKPGKIIKVTAYERDTVHIPVIWGRVAAYFVIVVLAYYAAHSLIH